MIWSYTIAELHDQHHALALYCLSCNWWGEINVDWLIQTGKGRQLKSGVRIAAAGVCASVDNANDSKHTAMILSLQVPSLDHL